MKPVFAMTAVDDPTRFRDALGRFATGVVAITAYRERGAGLTGLAANSFTSVSLEPPLVLFCVATTSTSWPQIRRAEWFGVNILSAGQRDLSKRFATRGSAVLRDVPSIPSPNGAPILEDSLAWLECTVESEAHAGDHDVVIARVRHLGVRPDGAPLIYFHSAYGRLAGADR